MRVQYTEGSRLMPISLVRISLLQFFKTFKTLLLMRFYMYLAILGLMRFFVLFISLLRSLAKNVPNAIFGKCDFFQVPKVA